MTQEEVRNQSLAEAQRRRILIAQELREINALSRADAWKRAARLVTAVSADDALRQDFGSLRCDRLLAAIPHVGKARAGRALRRCHILETRRLRELPNPALQRLATECLTLAEQATQYKVSSLDRLYG